MGKHGRDCRAFHLTTTVAETGETEYPPTQVSDSRSRNKQADSDASCLFFGPVTGQLTVRVTVKTSANAGTGPRWADFRDGRGKGMIISHGDMGGPVFCSCGFPLTIIRLLPSETVELVRY